jgi:hypothetical protein
LLEMSDSSRWRDTCALGREPLSVFRRKALQRIRKLAPMFPKPPRSS